MTNKAVGFVMDKVKMDKYIEKLLDVELFKGMTAQQMPKVLHCLGGSIKHYEKNKYIYFEGCATPDAGIVLEGHVQMVSSDSMGNRLILGEFGVKDFFAYSLTGLNPAYTPLNVVTVTPSAILFFNCDHILNAPSSCTYHNKLADNLLKIMTSKTANLNQKINVLSKRTIREKIMTFLTSEASKNGSCKITLNFNRQELADYLCVDRSALSRELGKLKNEGQLDFSNNNFELLM